MKQTAGVKHWWPLVLVAALWLIILSVPSLNLLFRIQLDGSAPQQFSALPAQTNVPNFWEKTALRFPNNIDVLRRAAEEYPVSEEAEEDAEYSDSDEAPYTTPMIEPQPGATPDPSLPKWQVFPGQLKVAPAEEKLRRLDLLIARFPKKADLIAIRLRETIGWMNNGRVGGEMSDAKLYENQAAGKPSPERSQEKPNFTAADLKKAIAHAQRGGQLEPDNGFFDWMQCYLLMQAWRDKEAFQALDAAARKKRFDDHSLSSHNAGYRALSTALGRPLIFEEKLGTFHAMLFPQFGRYREMARILSWQAVKAQRKGEHKLALRIAAGLGLTSARMRENCTTLIEGLVASAMESIAWSSPTYDTRKAGGRRRIAPRQRADSFQDYAKKHGRSDLVAVIERNYKASSEFRTLATSAVRGSGSSYGVSYVTYIFTALTWIAGVLLLLLLPLSLLAAAIFQGLSRIEQVRRVLRVNESNAAEIPNRREMWSGALACGGVRAVGTALSGVVVIGLAALSFVIGTGHGAEISKSITDFQTNVIGGGGAYVGMEGLYYLVGNITPPDSWWRSIVALSPLLFGTLFVAWRATEFQKRQNGETPFSTRTFFKSLLQGHAYRSPSGERDDLDIGAAILKLSEWFLMLALIAAWYTLATITGSDDYSAWLIPLTLVCFFGGILLWMKIASWRVRPRRVQAVRYGLRLLRSSLLAWVVLGSTLYFVLLAGSLPLRQKIEYRVDRMVQLGEMKALATDTK